MSRLRVARIPYLNSVPFYGLLEGAEVELIDLPPRQLGAAAARGQVDAGIMSMCDVFRSPQFEPLGAMGVAADGPAHSVLLLAKVPPSELEGATVAITTETSTSYPLLRLLLERRYRVRPSMFVRRPSGPLDGDDAVLLIGDQALRVAANAGLQPGTTDYSRGLIELATAGRAQPWAWALDLAMAWKQWQGMPFVFARWVVRCDVALSQRARLLDLLSRSLEESLRELRSRAAEHAAGTGLQSDAAYAYLMGFTYRLGPVELDAIERFRSQLAGAPWWEASRPAVLSRSLT